MPPRLPEEKRAAILDDIKAGGSTCRGLARKHGVSDRVVRKIADENDIADPWSRAQTESATRARTADMKDRRTRLSAELLDDVERLRARAWSEYQVVMNSREGPDIVKLPLPPLRDVQAAYTSLGIAVDKHTALVKLDTDNGVGEARGMLGALADALGVIADQLPGEE